MTRCRAAAAATVALCAVVRASVVYDPLPGWSGDPINAGLGVIGLGPSAFIALDAVAIVAFAVALFATPRAPIWSVALWLIGTVAAAYHALAPGQGDLEHARLGLAWSAALATGLTAALCAQDPRCRRWVLAFAIGFVAMLASKGALQVFIEHPATVAAFDVDPAANLRAQGIEPGTAGADIYERRLRGAEATGWFGLSNVYATFAAAALVAFCAVLATNLRRKRGAALTACAALGLVAAAGALIISGSKGGLAAAAVGIAWCALAPRLAPRLGPFAGVLGLGVVWAVLLTVVCRGFVGTAIGELSILFRAFYIDAAARVFLDHPILGIGPGDFRAGYLLHKPPLSPEEVTSPHSVLLDFAATLGVLGLAWGALILRFAWRLGAEPLRDDLAIEPDTAPVTDARLLLIAAVLVTLASAWTEQHGALAEAAVARLIGLAAWIAAGYALLRAQRRALPASGAAIALLAHAQIEMTLTTPTSAALVALIVGSTITLRRERDAPVRRRALGGAAALVAIGAAVLVWFPAQRWSAALSAARSSVGDLAELRAGASAPDPLLRQRAARALATSLGRPVPERPDALARAWADLARVRLAEATTQLAEAHRLAPRHLPTAAALARTLTTRIAIARASGADASVTLPLWIEADAVTERMTDRRPNEAGAWSRLASLRIARAEATGDLARLPGAVEPARRTAELDPRGPAPAARLARLYAELNQPVSAAAWARRALQLDANRRLDPLRRFSDAERAELERVVAAE